MSDQFLIHHRSYDNVVRTAQNTPLVRLNRVVPAGGAAVYLKCEFFNPLGSVKDRIGKAMIEAAEAQGKINKDTHIVEATSGNTGVALSFVCAAKGYRLTIVMPDSMSQERRALIRAMGAELILTPAAVGTKGAIIKAGEIIASEKNAWMPQQFENPANPEIHRITTGAEIWDDTQGKADILVSGVGTGGTVTGVSRYFKLDKGKKDFKSFAVEPAESAVISGGKPGPHKIQGLGAGFVPKNLDLSIIDGVEQVLSEEALTMARRLSKEEGLLVGISTGANVHVAATLAAKPENKGKIIVAIGCDTGERYLSTPLYKDLVY